MSAYLAHILLGERFELGHDFRFSTASLGKDLRIERHVAVGPEVPHCALRPDVARLRGKIIGVTVPRRRKEAPPHLTPGALLW